MRVASLRCRLAPEHVREIPDVQGVFTLWDANECVYISHTPWNLSLRECLRQHLVLRDERVIDASHFTWETSATPKSREYDLLALCIEKNGKLPRYNRGNSPLRPPKTCITDLRARS
jgi:hypothetical protein